MNNKDFEVDEIDLEGIENDPELLRELAEIGRELDLEASSKPIISTTTQPSKKKVSNKSSSSTAVADINLDISHLLSSNTDNLHVDFNEDDENDPELLAALEGLKKDTDESELQLSTSHSMTGKVATSTSTSAISVASSNTKVSNPVIVPSKSSQPSVVVSPKPTQAVSQSQTQLMVPKSATISSSKVSNTGETSPRSALLITQYKQKALSFKKEGKLEEAKEWLIKAKNLEKSEGIKGKKLLL